VHTQHLRTQVAELEHSLSRAQKDAEQLRKDMQEEWCRTAAAEISLEKERGERAQEREDWEGVKAKMSMLEAEKEEWLRERDAKARDVEAREREWAEEQLRGEEERVKERASLMKALQEEGERGLKRVEEMKALVDAGEREREREREKERAEYADEVREKTAECDKLSQQVETLKATQAQYLQQIRALQEASSLLREGGTGDSGAGEMQLGVLRQELESAQAELLSSARQHRALLKRLDALKQEKRPTLQEDEIMEQLHTLKGQLWQAQKDLADERLAHLATLKEFGDEKSEHQMSKLVAEKQHERGQRDLALLRDELQDTKRDMAAQEAQLNGQVRQLQLAVARVEEERQRASDLLRDERAREQEREREKVRDHEAERKREGERSARERVLRRHATCLQQDIECAQQELAAIQQLCDRARHEHELERAREAAARQALLERVEMQDQQLARAEAAVTAAYAEKTPLFENLALLKEEKARAEERLEFQQGRLQELSVALQKAEAAHETSQQAARDACQKAESHRVSHRILQLACEQAESQKEQQQRDLAALRQHLEQLQQHVTECKLQATAAQREHARAAEEVGAYKTRVADLEETAAARERQTMFGAAALDEAHTELNLQKSNLQIVSARVAELEAQSREQALESERLRRQLMVVELEKVPSPHAHTCFLTIYMPSHSALRQSRRESLACGRASLVARDFASHNLFAF
jgi:hypothetical protein